jgi:predicted DsbA family dithiol-disulfide isomerase
VTDYATRSGVDLDRFNACMADAQSARTVQHDIALAHSVGVTATPTLSVNGRPLVGAVKPWMLEAGIDEILPLAVPSGPTPPD